MRPSLVAVATFLVIAPVGAKDRPAPPETRRVDQLDTYHGIEVADPYRWLEDDVRKSKEVEEWVTAQNRVTHRYLDSLPARDAIETRLTALWNYEKYTSPRRVGRRYVYHKNNGLQNQSVLYVMDSLDGEPRILLDPNSWSKDGTVALSGTSFSDDSKYLAYGVADAGSDWSTWRVMEVATGRALGEELKWLKFSGAAWTNDGRGFFYGRFDEPAETEAHQSLNLNHKIYYHRIGTPQGDDVLVHRDPANPDWGFDAQVSEDGRYLIITVWKGTDDRYRVLYRDLIEPYGMTTTLIDNFDHEYGFIGNDGPVFYFKTDYQAPMGRVVAIDIRQPEPDAWREVVPQTSQPLSGVSLVANMFTLEYLEDAHSHIVIRDLTGKLVREVALPSIGSADGFGGQRTDTETFYSFSSFATPPSIYRYDMLSGESTLFRQAKVDFNPADYEVSQVFYSSKDGTRVPMFITHKKGIARDGSAPTLLFGYGGFNISLTPSFSVSRLMWMEMGGVLAIPNLRGGGEYGDDWHKAGTKLHKQNVFDDFIAAAEYLIAQNYTRRERLAIQGGSNGGLLVGAVMTQRPDLFAACLPAVGVMDMLRFHKFTAGRYWVDDYGSADDPTEFKALRAYSPCHNIVDGQSYPATLVTTADTDDRVVPGHSFKFAAALQHAQKGEAPVLIRIESRAGHGAGTPTAKLVRRVSDEWAFLARNLGIAYPAANTTAEPSPRGERKTADSYP